MLKHVEESQFLDNITISFFLNLTERVNAYSKDVLQGGLEKFLLHESDFCVRVPLRVSLTGPNSLKDLSPLIFKVRIPGKLKDKLIERGLSKT